jgi:hypothetical protein
MIVTTDPVHGTGRRHRIAVIGSGFGGLTATKALKHAQVNITDALVFLTRITAQGTSHVVNPTPLWVQVIPATTAVATTIGVLIALYVGVVRELKKAAEECRHHQAQMNDTASRPSENASAQTVPATSSRMRAGHSLSPRESAAHSR